MKGTATISSELLMKAAKFQQNHRIKADIVMFDCEQELIIFKQTDNQIIAEVDYNSGPGKAKYKIYS